MRSHFVGKYWSAAKHLHQTSFLFLFPFVFVDNLVHGRVVAQVVDLVDEAGVLALGLRLGVQGWQLRNLLITDTSHVVLL